MLNNIAKSFQVLGHRSKDRVTGVEGVITTVTFDLYGCIQVLLHPGIDKEGKQRDQVWLDINRLEPIPVGAERVMPLPGHLADWIRSVDVAAETSGSLSFTEMSLAEMDADALRDGIVKRASQGLTVGHDHGAADKPLPSR